MVRWLCFSAVGLIALVTSPAMAQRGDDGRSSARDGVYLYSLTQFEPVQKELALTEEQNTEVRLLLKEFEAAQQTFLTQVVRDNAPKLTPEAKSKLTEEYKATQTRAYEQLGPGLAAILSPEQMTRLKQVRIQRLGGAALNDADVRKKLSITTEQQGKLTSLSKEFADKSQAMIRDWDGTVAIREVQEKTELLRKQIDTEMFSVLTPTQSELFREMKGKDFDLTTLPMGNGPPRAPSRKN
jgi:hypothetical protein